MYRYRTIKTNGFPQHHRGGNHYGIIAEKLCNDAWLRIILVPDVSTRQTVVSHLAEKCTRGQLDPVHLMDVILDCLP